MPQAAALAAEQERLRAKLQSGLVRGVWLQFGSNLPRLRDGLAFLRNALPQRDNAPVEIYGEVPQWSPRSGLRFQ